jgi:subtilisin family serine protease
MMRAALLLTVALTASSAAAGDWRHKVDPSLLREAQARTRVELLVMLEAQADLGGAAALRGREQRGAWVYARAADTARRTQPAVIAAIERAGASHRAFSVVNAILVEGADRRLLRALAERADVRHVHANPRVALKRPARDPDRAQIARIEPNIIQTGAPEQYWAAGITGEGIVVANQDTGVQWTHPALRPHYLGVTQTGVSHDYHWHDAIHSGGGVCGPDSPVPCDDDDHGTQTMGVIVGADGAGNQIGMAPGAKWIACRNMDQGVGTPASYLECFDFFLAPTDLGGQNPDPSRAPHVVNNSWICTFEEGCEDPNILRPAVEALRAAGIFVVASAGNSGNGCGSVESPPAIYDAAFSVGAVNIFGEVEGFSSRGPVVVDGSYRLKPDVAAPGDNIRSSVRGGGYAWASGTSLSGPHVAGLAALMLSADACFSGNSDAIESWITRHTHGFPSSEVCGAFDSSRFPNTTSGWGTIEAVLPAPGEACDLPIAGTATGLSSGFVRCVDRSSGDDATSPLVATTFDCDAAGLATAPGDDVVLTIRSEAFAGSFAGSVIGMTPVRASCRNVASGQSVAAPIAPGTRRWNCTAAGFVALQGELVQMTVTGRAD